MQVTIPRWAQMVGIPLLVLVALYLARAVGHALFVFLLATLLSLLLNPVVEGLRRLRLPRAIGATLVYASFAAAIVVILIVVVPPVIEQARDFADRLPQWADEADRQAASLQAYLDRRGIELDLQDMGAQAIAWVEGQGLESAGTVFNVGVGIVGSLFTLLMVIIISFYMLVDGRRITCYLARVLPGDEENIREYLAGLQSSFTRYVKGQSLLALSVGLAAGLGVWVLGWDLVGIWPEGSQYALLFGVWAGITEVIPYVGPWLGALPPVLMALPDSPVTALWVALVFWLVQTLEGHILAPNIMGATLGVHPLMVIFALLAGAEVGGLLGMLAVLPLLAMVKHTVDFYDIRLSRSPWIADDGVVPVLQGPPQTPPAADEDPTD